MLYFAVIKSMFKSLASNRFKTKVASSAIKKINRLSHHPIDSIQASYQFHHTTLKVPWMTEIKKKKTTFPSSWLILITLPWLWAKQKQKKKEKLYEHKCFSFPFLGFHVNVLWRTWSKNPRSESSSKKIKNKTNCGGFHWRTLCKDSRWDRMMEQRDGRCV